MTTKKSMNIFHLVTKCFARQCNIESAFFSFFNFEPAGSFRNRISFSRQPAAISTLVYQLPPELFSFFCFKGNRLCNTYDVLLYIAY